MDEQRLAAYLELIQALLECPSGANDILNAYRELVDADFVQIVEALAENMVVGCAVNVTSNTGSWSLHPSQRCTPVARPWAVAAMAMVSNIAPIAIWLGQPSRS